MVNDYLSAYTALIVYIIIRKLNKWLKGLVWQHVQSFDLNWSSICIPHKDFWFLYDLENWTVSTVWQPLRWSITTLQVVTRLFKIQRSLRSQVFNLTNHRRKYCSFKAIRLQPPWFFKFNEHFFWTKMVHGYYGLQYTLKSSSIQRKALRVLRWQMKAYISVIVKIKKVCSSTPRITTFA